MPFGLPVSQDSGASSVGDSTGYWAAQDAQTVAKEAESRVEKIGDDTDASGRKPRWLRSLMAYYAQDTMLGGNAGSDLRSGGEMGELLMTRVNQYRCAAQQIINLVTRSALAYDAVAHDDSSVAQRSQKLAGELLKSCVRRLKLEEARRLAVEYAVVLDESFLLITWDARAGGMGTELSVGGGQPAAEGQAPAYAIAPRPLGDVRVEVFGPQDVFRDLRSTRPERDWYIVRRWVNRWDLVADHVDLREDILRLQTRDQLEGNSAPLWTSLTAKSDEVAVFDLYHRKTAAIPEGRFMRYSNEDTIYADGPLPYADVPIERVSAGTLLDSGASYTSMYDILGLQSIYDAVWSSVTTIADIAGVPNFHTFEGADLQVEELPGGGRKVTSRMVPGVPDGGRPTIMAIPPVPDVHVKLLTAIPEEIRSILSLSKVVGGDAPKGMPGNLAALLSQNTADFYTPLLRSCNDAMERVGGHILDCFARFADQRRTFVTEGASAGQTTMSFIGTDLKAVASARVDMGNPLADSAAGRAMLADDLLERFPNTMSRDDYLEMRRTGRVDPLFDAEASEDELIEAENEILKSWDGPAPDINDQVQMHDFTVALGSKVVVDKYDDHARHIAKHRANLNDPRTRFNPGRTAANHAHIEAHLAQMAGPVQPPQPGAGPGAPGAKPPGADGQPNPTDIPPNARDAGVRPAAPATPAQGAPPPAVA